MIASLLNRPYKKLVLDRYIEQGEKESVLEIEPETVKRGIAAHYENQFRKRATRLEEMSEKWKELYRPRKDIDEKWYSKVKEEVEQEEWREVLRELKVGTAPGISGISYILIKRAG